jgi:hypothetical protein
VGEVPQTAQPPLGGQPQTAQPPINGGPQTAVGEVPQTGQPIGGEKQTGQPPIGGEPQTSQIHQEPQSAAPAAGEVPQTAQPPLGAEPQSSQPPFGGQPETVAPLPGGQPEATAGEVPQTISTPPGGQAQTAVPPAGPDTARPEDLFTSAPIDMNSENRTTEIFSNDKSSSNSTGNTTGCSDLFVFLGEALQNDVLMQSDFEMDISNESKSIELDYCLVQKFRVLRNRVKAAHGLHIQMTELPTTKLHIRASAQLSAYFKNNMEPLSSNGDLYRDKDGTVYSLQNDIWSFE